ncbi:MAG: insulinase family protein, partial [Firmicutes bacterium]|nr:insulinase family protein [Bacillota bacterium]
APEYIRQFVADDREMTKYIIGTISQMDIPLTPSMKGEQAASRFISGLTQDAIQRERDEVLSSTQKDIRAMADFVEDVLKQQYICVLGSETRIRQNAELFGALVKVFD